MTTEDKGTFLPILETLCPNCSGDGGAISRGTWVDCTECKGAGHIPTAAGERLLAMVKHNLHLLLDERRNQ